jgi:hypothetical protein
MEAFLANVRIVQILYSPNLSIPFPFCILYISAVLLLWSSISCTLLGAGTRFFHFGLLGLKLCGYFVLERFFRWAAVGILWSGFRTLAVAVRRCFEDQKWAENWNKMPREIITLQCGQCGNQACHFPHTTPLQAFLYTSTVIELLKNSSEKLWFKNHLCHQLAPVLTLKKLCRRFERLVNRELLHR